MQIANQEKGNQESTKKSKSKSTKEPGKLRRATVQRAGQGDGSKLAAPKRGYQENPAGSTPTFSLSMKTRNVPIDVQVCRGLWKELNEIERDVWVMFAFTRRMFVATKIDFKKCQ